MFKNTTEAKLGFDQAKSDCNYWITTAERFRDEGDIIGARIFTNYAKEAYGRMEYCAQEYDRLISGKK